MDANQAAPLTAEELAGLDDLDLDTMDRPALALLLGRVQATYPALVALEPKDPESEEYLLWEEDLETLDDYIDELTERLA